MKYHHLVYFVAAAQSGSFSSAARSVRLAQPAFSLHIRAFEEELGIRLFDRSNKGASLTKAGKNMRIHAESILKLMKHAKEDVLSKTDVFGGDISIAISASISTLMIGDLFKEIHVRFPGIKLNITDTLVHNSGKLIESGQLDFGLLPAVSSLSKVCIEPALSQDIYLVGKTFDHLPDNDHINFKDLSKQSLIMGSTYKTPFRKELESMAILENCNLRIDFEQDSIGVRKNIVLTGLASTVVPYSTFALEIAEGKLVAKKIIKPSIRRVLSFVWSQIVPLSPAAIAVKNIMYEIMSSYIQKGFIKGYIIK